MTTPRKPLTDPRDYVLDLSTAPAPSPATAPAESTSAPAPKSAYLSIHFRCCGVYAPIYRNREKTAYVGHCPRCARKAEIAIGPGGSTSRIFEAF